jgi:hypothetical protein
MKNKYFVILGIVVFTVLLVVVIERTTLPQTTPVMIEEAVDYGERIEKAQPPEEFAYDGCTFFVDSLMLSDFRGPCLRHDIAYWHGGTKEERREADKILREEMIQSGLCGKIVAYPAYFAVRLFGDTFITKSVNANWGYGWD